MAPLLKPSLNLGPQDDDFRKKLQNEFQQIKFEFPSVINQLKKLFIYLALLFVQQKPVIEKDADKIKLPSSFNYPLSTEDDEFNKDLAKMIEKNNLLTLVNESFLSFNLISIKDDELKKYSAQIEKIKLMILDHLKKTQSNADNFQKNYQSKRDDFQKKTTRKTSSNKRKSEKATEDKGSKKLSDSYTTLKMHSRAVNESEKDFRERLRENFKREAREHHPDKGGSSDKFRKAQEAYDHLYKFHNLDYISPENTKEEEASSKASMKHK